MADNFTQFSRGIEYEKKARAWGEAGRGTARRGRARYGKAWQGGAGSGEAW